MQQPALSLSSEYGLEISDQMTGSWNSTIYNFNISLLLATQFQSQTFSSCLCLHLGFWNLKADK
jgi:hypothetical protein